MTDWRGGEVALAALLPRLHAAPAFLADIDVVCGTDPRPVPAHRLLLALASPSLQDRLYPAPPGPQLRLETADRGAFLQFLHFAYTGRVEGGEPGWELLALATQLQRPDLARVCRQHALASLCPASAMRALEQSLALGELELEQTCWR